MHRIAPLLLLVFFLAPKTAPAPQPPAKFSVLLNDADQAITVGVHTRLNEWQDTKIESHTDANVDGDAVRVISKRTDNAIITLEYPIAKTKKYRVLWNPTAGIWDILPAQ